MLHSGLRQSCLNAYRKSCMIERDHFMLERRWFRILSRVRLLEIRMKPTRRDILKTAVAAPMIVPSHVLGQRSGSVAPSDKIVFGGIGIGARGGTDLRALLSFGQARFVAIADVRNSRREE